MVARRVPKSERFSKTIVTNSQGRLEKRQVFSGADSYKVKEVMIE